MGDATTGIDLNSITIAELIEMFVDEIILSAEYLEMDPEAEGSANVYVEKTQNAVHYDREFR